eukprot:CAMPEP_0170547540 /NCGR_PEP_ID=MMETSP0211-20121228/5958_1 /TAXON_ID=311385 /ORGANISM="Pseudokeronopsis sp., Strain OXSARD2" /LENGTH=69 /DNA_ID=CAMNT_0010852665 /DNA_START=1 /DNA_END=206 /DNA_ORIENTATION=-
MNEDMKLRAIEYVMSMLAQEKNKSLELEIARGLKKEFDTKFHPTWQCIVGKNFGSDIGFEATHMIYFYL